MLRRDLDVAAPPRASRGHVLNLRVRNRKSRLGPKSYCLGIWTRHLQIFADLSGEVLVDLVVAGNRRGFLSNLADVNGVVASLA